MLLLAACDPRTGRRWIGEAASAGAVEAPSAEFLLTGVDSSFWILTGPDAGPSGFTIRRAPLVLARVAGRWQELYVVEEDHSFPDAIFVVQALWRRDLMDEDSALVLGDSLVPALAAQYARSHPDEVPLEPDEPEDEDPSIIAVAELSLLDVKGRYASVEHYSDLHLPLRRERHVLRRAVVDLDNGREVPLAALMGEKAAADLARRGRAALVVARDSARRVAGQFDAVAAAALDRFDFDERSFALTQLAGQPGVVFYAVGRGDAADGFALPLQPMAVAGGAWWDSARVELPLADAVESNGRDGTADARRIWRRGELTVIATADDEPAVPGGNRARPPASEDGAYVEVPSQRLTLRDASGREWPLGSITSSAQRLYWLDRGAVSAEERRALSQAFYQSAFLDGTLRAASAPGSRRMRGARGALPLQLASTRAVSLSLAASTSEPTTSVALRRTPPRALTVSPVAAQPTQRTSVGSPRPSTPDLSRGLRSPILRSTSPASSR